MKILHFGKFYPPFNGGMEIYLRDLAEKQTENHTVTALVHNHDFNRIKSQTKTEIINLVEVIRQKTLKPILFTPIMLGANRTVNELISKDKVDLIHISWPNPSALFLLLNKKAKSKPWIIQWQSDMVTQNSSLLLKLAYQFFKPFEKLLLKRSRLVIASTQEYFKYSNALQKFKSKCHFVPLALANEPQQTDIETKQWAQEKWKKAPYKVFNIGRLTFYKNQKLLIKAASIFPKAHFIITGSGELHEKLKQLIEKSQLKNVTLTGGLSKTKLHALLESCDVFCLPSNDRAESYGMVLLEALNLNKKILVSDLNGSGMKWIAAQTPLGSTFENNNCENLVDELKSACEKKPATFDNNIFKIETCANSIDKLYNTVL
ncbi:MAG: glycosyltransferase [Marinicellaceae bacterium]